MSYTGTVYCSYCRLKGHNRRGCPKRKEYIANNPDSAEAHYEEYQKERRKRRPRQCSYCREQGHTARTCKEKEYDKILLMRKLKRQRQEIKEGMIANGFGIGALVEVPEGYWTTNSAVALISDIDWLHTDRLDSVVYTLLYVKRNWHQKTRRSILVGTNEHKVLSGVSPKDIIHSFPSGWENGTLYNEESYFPKGESQGWWVDSEKRLTS